MHKTDYYLFANIKRMPWGDRFGSNKTETYFKVKEKLFYKRVFKKSQKKCVKSPHKFSHEYLQTTIMQIKACIVLLTMTLSEKRP